ncbi:hypothetical protein BJ165DRAFT_862852 [Panaeolus papilionaceus]|nr:hypothetical protein BJ165DRAFT_862852 [Panaeolus papilionaceus]
MTIPHLPSCTAEYGVVSPEKQHGLLHFTQPMKQGLLLRFLFQVRISVLFQSFQNHINTSGSPGPAYVYINISLPICEDSGGGFTVRAYVHGLDADTSQAVGVACAAQRSNIDHLEFYSNLVDISGNQTATIELVNSGDAEPVGGGPLLLDSFGYLDVSTLTRFPSATQSSTSASTPINTSDVPRNSDGNTTVVPTPPTNAHRPLSTRLLIGLCVVLSLVLITISTLLIWRKRVLNFFQKRRRRSSNASEIDLVQLPQPSPSVDTPRYSTLGYSSIYPGMHRQLDSETSLDRSTSPNSLFDDTQSTTSTVKLSCILGEDPKHGECFCPSCSETRSNRVRQSAEWSTENSGRPTSSSVQSHARSSITVVEANAGHRFRVSSAGTSHTVASANFDPFADDHTSITSASLRGTTPSSNPFGDD